MPNAPAPINHGAIMPVSGWAPTRPVRFSLGDRQLTATNCHFISPSFFSWSEGFNRESLCVQPDISYLIKAILSHGNGRKSKTLKRQKDQQLCFNGPKVAFVLHAVHTRKSTLNVFISAEYFFSYFLKQVAVNSSREEKRNIFLCGAGLLLVGLWAREEGKNMCRTEVVLNFLKKKFYVSRFIIL